MRARPAQGNALVRAFRTQLALKDISTSWEGESDDTTATSGLAGDLNFSTVLADGMLCKPIPNMMLCKYLVTNEVVIEEPLRVAHLDGYSGSQ